MSKKIKFSVLMSVYYKEKASFLESSLESIFNQTLKPDEVVVVKDGQVTEELDSVINKYKNNYNNFKIVTLRENQGLGNALNEGLKHCKYNYVARMDSDDISASDRFMKQINYFRNNPKCDLVGGNIIEFNTSTGEELSRRVVPCGRQEILKFLKKRNPFNHVTVMFKKTSVIESGGYQDCPCFEDYYLWSRMLKNNKDMNNINENLVYVRAGLEMSKRRGNIRYIKYIIKFEKKLLKLNLINIGEFMFNILVRIFVAIMPNFIRYKLYQRRLRSENN